MLFLSKTGWERPRKREKNFTPEFCSYSSQATISKKKKLKNWKTSFRRYFYTNRDEIRWERVKKILVPNSVHTRPGQENSEINRKIFKKFKNLFLALFFAKTGWDRTRKRGKHFSPEFCSHPTQARKFGKNIAKKFKKLKNLFAALFLVKTGWDRPRKTENKF